MRNLGSVIRGIRAMHSPLTIFRYWEISLIKFRLGHEYCFFWCHYWTPAWHEGRGPYVSIGCAWLYITRGY